MKKISFLFLFAVFHSVLFSQHDFGIKASFGMSELVAKRDLFAKTQFLYRPSFQGGFFYNFNINKTSLIGFELLYTQIEGKEHSKFVYIDPEHNSIDETSSFNSDYHLSYLALPIYYGLKLKKLTIQLGIQAGVLIKDSGNGKLETNFGGQRFVNESKGKMNIDKYDTGIRGAFIYNLSKRFSIEAGYYYGVNNIMNSNAPSEWNWKIRQITLGLRYKIFTKDRK